MAQLPNLIEALQPLTAAIAALKASDPAAAPRALEAQFPLTAPAMQALRALVRDGVEAKWLCDREAAGVRYSRVVKAPSPEALSIDAVHMEGAGAGHTHVHGEFDLCFAVSGAPKFDARPEGWVVYAPNTWHVPTVEGGLMDILYFLPGGGIRFGEQPEGSTAVGLQAH
jgi:hypothetical protein